MAFFGGKILCFLCTESKSCLFRNFERVQFVESNTPALLKERCGRGRREFILLNIQETSSPPTSLLQGRIPRRAFQLRKEEGRLGWRFPAPTFQSLAKMGEEGESEEFSWRPRWIGGAPASQSSSEGRDSSGNNNLNRKHLISLTVFMYSDIIQILIFRRQKRRFWLLAAAPPTFANRILCGVLEEKASFLVASWFLTHEREEKGEEQFSLSANMRKICTYQPH